MRALIPCILIGLGIAWMASPQAHAHGSTHAEKQARVKVVYHMDADNEGTTSVFRHVKNQLAADPTAEIVVVAIGKSVPFLVNGADTEGGYPYSLMVQDLQQRGVRVEACGNTIKTLKIDPKTLDDGIKVVPSGMDELARLQSLEGYAYIRP